MDKFNTSVRILIGESLSIDDMNVLSLLYMPIIGERAYTLYMTMYSALNRSSNARKVLLSDITDLFGMTIKDFTKERKKLEAIGLMNTYFKDDEYVLLLKAPLSARRFFNDCSLGSYLSDAVGETLYLKLVNIFRIESFDKEGFKNVTEIFDNVFKSEHDGEIKVFDGYFIDKNMNSSIKKGNYDFDYEAFLAQLNLSIAEKNNLTAEFQTIIEQTAYTYNLKEEDMQYAYFRSIDQDGKFSITKLTKEARNISKKKEASINDKKLSAIEKLKITEPKELLRQSMKKIGLKPTHEEYEVIEKVVDCSPYDISITNVIIAHALSNYGYKCPDYGYFYKAIETFLQFKIKTFDEAIKFVTDQSDFAKRGGIKKEEKQAIVEPATTKSTGSKWLDQFLSDKD
jgi:replication initiation and membrane attachment protein